jgi:hypothetical protein
MNSEANLSPKMVKTATITALAAVAAPATAYTEAGEVAETELLALGAGSPQLSALVRRGILVRRQGVQLMTTGPYKGQEIGETYYSVA